MRSVTSSRGPVSRAVAEVAINLPQMGDALAAVLRKLRAREGFTLFTINLDHIVKLGSGGAFLDAYKRANFVTADGWPVVWLVEKQRAAGRHADAPVERRKVQRTTGADLLAPMCQLSAEHGFPLYFVGPGPQSQADGIEILRARHPGLSVAGAEAPKLPAIAGQTDIDAMAERINRSGAQLCVLSLGAPKQELLADALHSKCPGVGFICVGAALDFISGHAVRAPMWTQKLGLEWFWRMANDPVRLVGRYALCALAMIKLALPQVFPNNLRLRVADPV